MQQKGWRLIWLDLSEIFDKIQIQIQIQIQIAMAHPQQLQFVKSITSLLDTNNKNPKVLEVGSYDVNGSIRSFFPNANYLGVDLIQGPGVDLVCEGATIPHPDNTYDVAISCECFEHNPSWAETFENMYRMTKDGGVLIFTCATTGRAEHGTTRTSPKNSPGTQALNWDYYNNLTEEDFGNKFDMHNLFQDHFFLTNSFSCDLFFFGVKGGGSVTNLVNSTRLKHQCQLDQEEIQNEIIFRKSREKYIPKPLRKIVRGFFPYKRGVNARLIDDL